MDEKKTLLGYIGPGPAITLVCVMLLAAMLLCAFYTPPAVEFEPQYPPPIPSGSPYFDDGEESQYAYLNAIAVSDAICQNPDGRLYYAVEDDSHYFRVVCMSGQTYALMGPQRDRWNSSDVEPSFIRLTGRLCAMPADVRQAFVDVFAMDGDVFDGYFGTLCLIEEPVVIPDQSRSPVWTVLAVIFALGFFATLALWLASFLPAWSAMVRLGAAERLGEAVRQLEDPSAREKRGGRLRLTEDFLFGRGSGLAAAWEDVCWCYERSLPSEKAALAHLLVIRTADGRAHPVFFPAQELKELRRLANAINARNPKMLWGFTPENREAWRKMCS